MQYVIVARRALLVDRAPASPRDGRVQVTVPVGSTLYMNGRAYAASSGTVRIPTTRLGAVNDVRLRYGGVVCDGESLLWDGTAVTPGGYDRDAVLLSAAASLSDATARIALLEDKLARLTERVESPLFS